MSVNVKQADRRELHFDSMQDLLDEVERLAAGEVETTGNWTLAQMMQHLSLIFNATIDGFGVRMPWLMRAMAKLFMKNRFLYKALPSGFKIPKNMQKFEPEDLPQETALENLRAAIQRLQSTDERAEHPIFGALSKEESDNFQLRHAELHLSFVKPKA